MKTIECKRKEGVGIKKLSKNELIATVSRKDAEILKSIYLYRCLSREQILQIHFKGRTTSKSSEERLTTRHINQLLRYELIREQEYMHESSVFFLTSVGIDVLRHFFLMPTNVYDNAKKVVSRGYYRASELEIYNRFINHQLHLNQFVIDFMERNTVPSVRYYDEKYASQYNGIRPDGILSFADVDVFLEMDMATESKNQLCDKWENYRNFLNSMEYEFREKHVIVLFVVGNTTREEERKNAVKYTIYERLLDTIDKDFDIIVGTHEELLEYLFNRFIPSIYKEDKIKKEIEDVLPYHHSIRLSDGKHLDEVFESTRFNWYGRKINELGQISVENGRVQEFLIDEYHQEPVGVMSKIMYFDRHNLFFKKEYGRNISYLVIVDKIEQIRSDLRMVDLLGLKNVYYTTINRLKEYDLPEAIFQFDLMGNVYHFKNNGLKERMFEQSNTQEEKL